MTRSPLPPLYAAWLGELLDGKDLPLEKEATCHDCAMVARKPPPPSQRALSFDATTKCCTFLPDIPNYLVGRILEDYEPTHPGRASIEERIDTQVAVTPLGLGIPAPAEILYAHAYRYREFGKAKSLRCPHYIEQAGHCGIWTNRMSTCATWYCKHDRGAIGMEFWRNGMQLLLAAIEKSLSRWCVLTIDPGDDALMRLFQPRRRQEPGRGEGSEIESDGLSHTIDWGDWAGRERDFYREAARLVRPLSWSDVLRIGGTDVEVHARLTKKLLADASSNKLPRCLRSGPFEIVTMDADYTRVSTYSPYDPLDLPNDLIPLLARFDGRPVKDVLAEIANEGIEIERALVQRLVDFEILQPA